MSPLPAPRLFGRRHELQQTLLALRPPDPDDATRPLTGAGKRPGLALVGPAGAGKSVLAARAVRTLEDDGFLAATHAGAWDTHAVAAAAGAALATGGTELAALGRHLAEPRLDDDARFALLGRVLAHLPLLLVLDGFDANLTDAGDAFRDPALPARLQLLLASAACGRVLVTSRHALPGLARHVATLAIDLPPA